MNEKEQQKPIEPKPKRGKEFYDAIREEVRQKQQKERERQERFRRLREIGTIQ